MSAPVLVDEYLHIDSNNFPLRRKRATQRACFRHLLDREAADRNRDGVITWRAEQ
jgi:hypothetical protein